MYLCKYIGIIYTVCHPRHNLKLTCTYICIMPYRRAPLSRGEVRQDCCCSKNVRYQNRGATYVAVLEKQERTGNLQNQKQGGENKTQNYEKRK